MNSLLQDGHLEPPLQDYLGLPLTINTVKLHLNSSNPDLCGVINILDVNPLFHHLLVWYTTTVLSAQLHLHTLYQLLQQVIINETDLSKHPHHGISNLKARTNPSH